MNNADLTTENIVELAKTIAADMNISMQEAMEFAEFYLRYAVEEKSVNQSEVALRLFAGRTLRRRNDADAAAGSTGAGGGDVCRGD